MSVRHTLLGSLDADYVFRSDTRRIEFTVIEDGMSELNDYCVAMLEALRREHERRIEASRRYLKADDGLLIGNFPRAKDEDEEDDTEVILRWQWFQPVVTKAICLLMLCAFVEKALRSLAWFVVDDPEQDLSGGSVDRYLAILRAEHERAFEEPARFTDLRARCRTLRTALAEADWTTIVDTMEGVDLDRSFRAATEYFEILEEAYVLEET